jgi:hypothetical protein
MTAGPQPAAVGGRRAQARLVIATGVALAAGISIAAVDSRPGWDDTGLTVGALLVCAAVAAAIGGSRPWLWAILVGAWLPLLEVPASGSPDSLVALAFAGLGALAGWATVRSLERGPEQTAQR